MFEELKSLLEATDDSDGTPGPGQVREAISETDSNLKDARERLERLEKEHADMLLSASDEAIEAKEKDIARAKRDIARLKAAREKLGERLDEAKERQEVAKLQAAVDEADKAREEGAELLEEFEEHAEAMVEILERIEELDQTVAHAQNELRHSDRGIKQQVEHSGDYDFETPGRPNNNMDPGAITEVTEIPPVSPGAPSWGSTRWRKPKTFKSSSSADSDHEQRPGGRLRRGRKPGRRGRPEAGPAAAHLTMRQTRTVGSARRASPPPGAGKAAAAPGRPYSVGARVLRDGRSAGPPGGQRCGSQPGPQLRFRFR